MGGQLIAPGRRALLPDALLVHAQRLEKRVGLLTDAAGKILALAPEAELAPAAWERFPGELWTAAPVLAHAHLDGWDAPAARLRRQPFASWIADLIDWRGSAGRLSPAASAAAACEELARAGCALVAAHGSEPGAEGSGGAEIEVLNWREIIDPFPEEEPAAALTRWRQTAGPDAAGLALHAPYTVDARLAREVFRAASGPVSLHFGETEEERELLAQGSGPLADLLQARRGRLPAARYASPVDWLAEAGGLRPGTLAVHGGALGAEELQTLARGGVQLVFCPGTHQWFGRPRPAFAAAGVFPSALGCDSRASNESLDPLREFRLACALLPGRSPAGWWQALTEGGARALARPDLGRLDAGRRARPLRFDDSRAWAAVAEAADPAGRAAAFCAWLAEEPEAQFLAARISDPHHA